jgi:ABC-2 type transport system ATP-binding protein
MRDLVRRLAGEGLTILLSSHLLYEVEELCNRVAIIRKGSIVYNGGLGELLATATTGYRLGTTEPERARTVLLAQPGIESLAASDGELRFTADEDTVARAAIALGQARIGITALVPQTASLEELFLGLTGGESSDHDREAVA